MNEIKYVLYARKSSESEDKQVQSIDDQLVVLRKIAKQNKLKVVEELHESKSAKAPFQRPEFTRMLKMIDKGEANAILCWHINRLSRNPAESGMIQQFIHDGKLIYIQTHDRLHLASDNDLIFSVEASMSSQYSRDLSSNVKRGIAAKIRNGGIPGLAMAGYLNDPLKKTIYPDPVRYPLVRKAFDMYLSGEYNVPQILEAMNDWGYTTVKRTRIGGGQLNRSSLYHILKNPRYAGWIPDPNDEGEFIKENIKYQPMITVAEYDRVQELLGSKGRTKLSESKRFILKGLLRCGECGCAITAEEHKKKLANGNVNIHRYYHCTKKKGPCNQQGSVREQDLLDQIDNLLDGYELTPKLYEWGMEALAEMAKKEVSERNDAQVMQFESITEVEKQLDRLLDMATKGQVDSEEYETKSKSLKINLKAMQDEQAKTAERTKNWYEYVGNILETLTNANSKFVDGSLFDKSQILLAIGQQPLLLDRTIQLTPNEWMVPIKNSVIQIREDIEKVRTMPDKIQKATEMTIKSTWWGR